MLQFLYLISTVPVLFSFQSKASFNLPRRTHASSFKTYLDKEDTSTNGLMDLSTYDPQDISRIEQDLVKLRAELLSKKAFIDTAEITIRKTEELLWKQRNNGSAYACVEYGYSIFEDTSFELNPHKDMVPKGALKLGVNNFIKELQKILNINQVQEQISDGVLENRKKISQLQLSNEAIWTREEQRPPIRAPLIIKIPYLVLCILLDQLFQKDPISRFFFLETVARMPYFSYITMLHTYETLGWYRRSATTKRVHFAEELNEYHHLLIMESLGGDQKWRVRFFAQHASIVYYFALIIVWVVSPSLAYNFSELIEAHAVDTYAEFAESNKALLQSLPAPVIAKQYYEADDMYVFDEFQTSRPKGSRRPKVDSLYDVFCAICEDEGEHVKTMASCQDPDVVLRSPNTEAAVLAAASVSAIIALLLAGDLTALDEKSLTLDAVQDAFKGVSMDTLVEGFLGGAAVSEGVTAGMETAGNAATAGGVLAKIFQVIRSIRFFIP